MAQVPLAPPPPSKDPIQDRWLYLLWKRISSSGQILWSYLDFSGSNLTDLASRNHADLQNINTASYTHLTATQATDLTDAGDSTLHFHSADRPQVSDTASIDLTLTGVTISGVVLPAGVDHAALGNLNSSTYSHLTAAQVTDLTDGGETTLHTHPASDSDMSNIYAFAAAQG